MVFACCFGGDGGDVDLHQKRHACAAPGERVINDKPAKGQDYGELPNGGTIKTGRASPSGNTASLSAVTGTNDSNVQLSLLGSSLAGMSGSWYERVSACASRLNNVCGAVLCSISILNPGRNHFTVVHVTEKDPEASAACPVGTKLPALQAVASRLAVPSGASELRYNSLQVLQLLQSPLLYSFSEHGSGLREVKQAPYDWQALHACQGWSEYCALPLMCDNTVVGAVTLICREPLPPCRPQLQPLLGSHAGGPHPPGAGPGVANATSILWGGDEQALRMMGLLLSVVLVGQDLQLAQQVGDIMAAVHDARNLQQVVTAVTSGAERVVLLKSRVAVTINLVVLPEATAGQGLAAAGAPPAAGEPKLQQQQSGPQLGQQQPQPALPATGRAIFFEEHGANMQSSRSVPNTAGELPQGSGAGGKVSTKLQRANAPADSQAGSSAGHGSGPGQGAPITTPAPLARSTSSTNGPVVRPGLTSVSASHEGSGGGGGAGLGPNSSHGALLWQASCVQARALGLRHTLLANLPATGTIVHDCASYMQQVGCPKRDLYLLSSCKGSPPVALALAPAPLRETDGSRLVLYAAVSTRLPAALLNEILAQSQQLATMVLAPLLATKLSQSGLAEEWALLLARCAMGARCSSGAHGTAATAVAVAAAMGVDGKFSNSAAGVGSGVGAGSRGGAGSGLGGGALGSGGGTSTMASSHCGSGTGDPLPAAGTSLREAAAAAALASKVAGGSAAHRLGSENATPHAMQSDGADATAAADAKSEAAIVEASASRAGAQGGTVTDVETSRGSQATVLSTAIMGTFAGDTRTHMGMLVSSFKDTINALQATRLDEAEELSVLKLGKVLGRGGSGLVFQGYLHMGLEVAVKLFENPDDTDLDPASVDNSSAPTMMLSAEDAPSVPAADGAAAAEPPPPPQGGGGAGPDGGGGGAAARRSASKMAMTQLTKRQRDLLRNALELGVTSSLSHPNIVQGYCHWVNVVLMQDASLNRCWLMGQTEYMALAPPGSPPPPLCSALVMEYCDMGSLVNALKRGTFTTTETKPNMEFIYMCLLEIALALRHLHTAKLAHCDLKPGNVLLRSSPRDPRGFVCKLADFGYAAILKDGLLPGRPAVLPDEACGTLQYMAPELFVAGRPVDASIDIFAFGMLMWELVTGRTPYSEGDYASRALMKAVFHGKRPAFPETTLSAYKNLALCCWSGDPTLRPTATVLVKLLRQQLESLKQHAATSSASAASSRT